jgi:CRISPR-associated protein Csb1
LRGLRGTLPDPKDGNEWVDASDEIRKYLLGLSLIAATTDLDLYLREGCLLRYADNGDTWYQVPRRGEPTQMRWADGAARKYAEEAAGRFRLQWPDDAKLKHDFDLAEAKKLLAKKTVEDEAETE